MPEQAGIPPHDRPARSMVVSGIFLAYHVLGFLWGWIAYVRPRLRNAGLIVIERYDFDIVVDPERYRLRLPQWILRQSRRIMPNPFPPVFFDKNDGPNLFDMYFISCHVLKRLFINILSKIQRVSEK